MIEVFIALVKDMLWMIKLFMLTLALAAIILIGAMVIVAIYSWINGEKDG